MSLSRVQEGSFLFVCDWFTIPRSALPLSMKEVRLRFGNVAQGAERPRGGFAGGDDETNRFPGLLADPGVTGLPVDALVVPCRGQRLCAPGRAVVDPRGRVGMMQVSRARSRPRSG